MTLLIDKFVNFCLRFVIAPSVRPPPGDRPPRGSPGPLGSGVYLILLILTVAKNKHPARMGFAPPFVPHPGNPFGVFAASGNDSKCNNDINLKIKSFILD